MFISHFNRGGPCWGLLLGDRFIGGHRLLGGRHATLRSVLTGEGLRAAVEEASALPDDDGAPTIAPAVRQPTIPDPAHVFCAGLNYAAHAAETDKATSEVPRIFLRAASSLVGHGAPLLRPTVSTQFDYEGEVAVVIGSRAAHVPEARAMDHVVGYTLVMDGSIRDWQGATTTMGKNFIGTGAMGPGLVPAWQVPDWRAMTLMTRVNGVEVQRTTLDRMIHTIPALIARLSRMTPLLPGDVVVTGTPEGIGCRRAPPLWLTPGDLVEVEVPGIGVLANRVADAGA
jgi:2-keto-4-pentenoate hydratase/2-oxohepta-3-ene-1,7-dioic acid hydratase in catechol pathway